MSTTPSPPIEKEVILLGLLAEGASHAYGLEEKIRTRQMTEWTDIAFSSVYRVLGRLVKQGLVDTRIEEGGQGASRKIHSLNERGRETLARGVLHYLRELVPVKFPLHIGLAFMTEAPRADVVAALAARAEGIEQAAAEVERIRALALQHAPCELDPAAVAAYRLRLELLFGHIRHLIEAERNFLREARDLIAQSEGSAPSDRRAPP